MLDRRIDHSGESSAIRHHHRFLFCVLAAALIGFAMVAIAHGMDRVESNQDAPGRLFSDSPSPIKPSEYGMAAVAGKLDTRALAHGANVLLLVLPHGTEVELVRRHIYRRGEEDLTWVGRVSEERDSEAQLTLKHGLVFGRVRIGQDTYELRSDLESRLIVEHLDLSLMPAEGDDAIPVPQPE